MNFHISGDCIVHGVWGKLVEMYTHESAQKQGRLYSRCLTMFEASQTLEQQVGDTGVRLNERRKDRNAHLSEMHKANAVNTTQGERERDAAIHGNESYFKYDSAVQAGRHW